MKIGQCLNSEVKVYIFECVCDCSVSYHRLGTLTEALVQGGYRVGY